MRLLENELLSRHTYYRIGGPARLLAIPENVVDLESLSSRIQVEELPWFVMGAGSNLLVSDVGFLGCVIKMSKFNQEISRGPGNRIRAGSSVLISTLLRRCAQEGWGGLEFLTGIPGTIGGAVRMNAGTHLGETGDRLRKVEAFVIGPHSGPVVYQGGDLKMEYRRNLFLPIEEIVTAVEWEITPSDPDQVKALIDSTLTRRKATQPLDAPSCGSVFKNPKSAGLTAWEVIDRLGLRGHRIGNAQISEKHSNWILNLGESSAADVSALIELIRSRAQAELGIEMHTEVVRLGF